MLEKQLKRYRRHKRVRAKVQGTAAVPRLSVVRSNKNIYAQLINDDKGQTLVAVSDRELKPETPASAKASAGKQNSKLKKEDRSAKVVVAYEVGKLVAQKAKGKKIEKVVFDKGGYKYHGRVKAVAEGAREGRLKF